jgi:hypothetical protein
LALAADLSGLCCEPLGPDTRVEKALDSIERNKVDAAILDISTLPPSKTQPLRPCSVISSPPA